MIQPSDWTKIKPLVGDDCKDLCNLCYEFDKLRENLRLVSPSLTGEDIQNVYNLSHQILSEYLKIVQAKIDDDTFKKVQNDIWSTLKMFFSDKGIPIDITIEIMDHKKRGTLSMHFPVFLSPIVSFVHSRIYNSLVEALRKIQPQFTTEFITSSTKKAGIMPEIKSTTEKSLSDLEEATKPPGTKPTKKKDLLKG